MLGAKSGRDIDKIAAAGLTHIPATCAAAPAYSEASLVIECRKVYWQDLDPAHFLDPAINRNYPRKDYHRAYFGEIIAVQGTQAYFEETQKRKGSQYAKGTGKEKQGRSPVLSGRDG